VSNSHRGLVERSATVEHLATTATGTGAVEECLLSLVRLGSAVSLPVAIASDVSTDSLLDSIRIYHSMWPLVGFHVLRDRVLPTLAVVPPDVVGRYHDCLARGDVPGILAQFAPGGVLREATSPTALHRGAEALDRFFTVLFARDGGRMVEQCAVADDGTSCALEYVVTAGARGMGAPQAGASVFERGQAGLLSAVRMYDDIEGPLPPS